MLPHDPVRPLAHAPQIVTFDASDNHGSALLDLAGLIDRPDRQATPPQAISRMAHPCRRTARAGDERNNCQAGRWLASIRYQPRGGLQRTVSPLVRLMRACRVWHG